MSNIAKMHTDIIYARKRGGGEKQPTHYCLVQVPLIEQHSTSRDNNQEYNNTYTKHQDTTHTKYPHNKHQDSIRHPPGNNKYQDHNRHSSNNYRNQYSRRRYAPESGHPYRHHHNGHSYQRRPHHSNSNDHMGNELVTADSKVNGVNKGTSLHTNDNNDACNYTPKYHNNNNNHNHNQQFSENGNKHNWPREEQDQHHRSNNRYSEHRYNVYLLSFLPFINYCGIVKP
jgi:hypothetical protein